MVGSLFGHEVEFFFPFGDEIKCFPVTVYIHRDGRGRKERISLSERMHSVLLH